jgi:hypothetical protein
MLSRATGANVTKSEDVFRHIRYAVCVRYASVSMRELGKFIVIIGVIATLIGLVIWSGFAPKWLGRLPGDIRIEREHSSFYFPIVTCIVISIVLSLLLSLFSIFRR